jgi:ankyrin repeat protein
LRTNIELRAGNAVVINALAQEFGNMTSHLNSKTYLARREAVKDRSASALHEAAFNGDVAVIKDLLNKGANINSLSSDQTTALHEATAHGSETQGILVVANYVKSFY